MTQKYRDYAPTRFDSSGAFLPDRQDWLVVPVGRTRDSGCLDESNFEEALEILGGEQEDLVEVHRFGHWGPGWFEIIIVHPSLEGKVEEIRGRLENYSVLDEEDFCRREEEEYEKSWNDWGCKDFVHHLQTAFRLGPAVTELLEDTDKGRMRTFYEDCMPSGEYYISEGSGVSIRTGRAALDCTREQLLALIKELRSGHSGDGEGQVHGVCRPE